ncbi:three component ABC system middle component [uncultured Acinetobacter sp.]|uniref:three component ABC system middle component n=1 Tax=uncultured Acinetobacter sp. TaxID=165433 RepID=UPI00258F94BC|nr:three component ABC system middle component [uncultured Acinetobacter sp.]
MNYHQSTPFDLRILFNPPYCGLVILNFINYYTLKTREDFPASLIFLILPLTLNNQILDIFSKNPKKNLYQLIENNTDIFYKFPSIIDNYIDITNEALFFLTESKSLIVDRNSILIDKKNIKLSASNDYIDLKSIKSVANTLAKINDLQSIFITLGVKI